MKFYVIVILLSYITESESIDDYLQISWLIDKIEFSSRMPLTSFMYYYEARTVVENVVIPKSAEKNYALFNSSIEELCTTNFVNISKEFKQSAAFCREYCRFEHELNFVFSIKNLQLWFLSYKNYTIESNNIIRQKGDFLRTK